jgi:hypothetical protein
MYRVLSEADKKHYAEIFALYLLRHSEQYIYRIKGQIEKEGHLQHIDEVIYRLVVELKADYVHEPIYPALQHPFEDNFQLEIKAVQAKTNEELESDNLQSVDAWTPPIARTARRITRAMLPI